MLLKTKGIPHLVSESIIGKVTRNPNYRPEAVEDQPILIVEGGMTNNAFHNGPYYSGRFQAILSTSIRPLTESIPSIFSVGTFDHLHDDDIIIVHEDGSIHTLYRPQSKQNFLLFTERCNSNCLMCSQPPKDRDDTDYYYNLYKRLVPIIPKDCFELGITGGEPTLLGNRFFELLQLIKAELPDTEIHCLTNGRSFAWKNAANRLGALHYERMMLGIPLYADNYQTHDHVVQARHAFNQTMQGLYNLAATNQRCEIRVVLHQLTIPRLTKLARFIYKNLPFVEHVAFMGLEYQGYTPHNIKKLWIDPALYMNELGEAAEYLSQMGMNVSIYNSQLCVMPKHLWKYNKKSISDWKNIYLDVCNRCAMINECGGLFASCANMHSEGLRPFDASTANACDLSLG